MAFTFSHAVIAPYLYRLTRQHLPLPALTIGTMLPDLTRVFFPTPIAHHLIGMLSINLIFGIVLCCIWYRLYLPILISLFNPKNSVNTAYSLSFFMYCIMALMIGNFSHLLWDSITHLDDRTWFFHDFLASNLHILAWSVPWYQFLQYFSSFIVLPWLYLGFKSVLINQNFQPDPQSPRFKQAKFHAIFALLISILLGSIVFIYFNFFSSLSNLALWVQGFKFFCLTGFGYFTVFCLLQLRILSR